MDTTLFLTKEEKTLFSQFPASVQDAWKGRITEETGSAYETPEQMDARMHAVNYDKYPKAKEIIETIKMSIREGKTPQVSFADFPDGAIDSFLFSLGASGISFLMESMLRMPEQTSTKDGMDGLMVLSCVRHETLESNAKVFA